MSSVYREDVPAEREATLSGDWTGGYGHLGTATVRLQYEEDGGPATVTAQYQVDTDGSGSGALYMERRDWIRVSWDTPLIDRETLDGIAAAASEVHPDAVVALGSEIGDRAYGGRDPIPREEQEAIVAEYGVASRLSGNGTRIIAPIGAFGRAADALEDGLGRTLADTGMLDDAMAAIEDEVARVRDRPRWMR